MRKILIAFCIFAGVMVSAGEGYAFKKGEHDCAKCHTLNEERAKSLLGAVIPNLKVLSVEDGPIQGIWEIGFDSNGQKGIVYLDYSLNYLLIRANVFSLKDKKNLTEESFLKINKVDLSGFPYKNALVMGDKAAKHKVIVFDDPD